MNEAHPAHGEPCQGFSLAGRAGHLTCLLQTIDPMQPTVNYRTTKSLLLKHPNFGMSGLQIGD